MNRETAFVIPRVLIQATKAGWRLFRNNVGRAWQGQCTESYGMDDKKRRYRVVELFNARMVKFGLVEGSSDLIGWRDLEITQDMVGGRVAQFCAVECKTEKYKRLSAEQRAFLSAVKRAGGYAAVARERGGDVDVEEYEE